MKDEMPDKQLDALLREWKVAAEPHPRFRESVWRRIAQREADAAATTLPARLGEWLLRLRQRPQTAWGVAAAFVVILGAGWLGFRSSPPQTPNSGSYLDSVDPYRMTP